MKKCGGKGGGDGGKEGVRGTVELPKDSGLVWRQGPVDLQITEQMEAYGHVAPKWQARGLFKEEGVAAVQQTKKNNSRVLEMERWKYPTLH